MDKRKEDKMIKTLVCLTYKLGIGVMAFYLLAFIVVGIADFINYIKLKFK
jgi:hypothetical protein